MTDISPLAEIHSSARVDRSASVGPFCILGPGAELAAGVRLAGRVSLAGRVTVGGGSRLACGVTAGEQAPPADAEADHELNGGEITPLFLGPGREPAVVIGDDVRVAAAAVIYRPRDENQITVIGDGGDIGPHAMIGPGCRLGAAVTVRHAATLSSDVHVAAYARLGAHAVVAPGVCIGESANIEPHSYVTQDVPPFAVAGGRPTRIKGIDRPRLARLGMDDRVITELEDAFLMIYQARLEIDAARELLRKRDMLAPAVNQFLMFLERLAERGERTAPAIPQNFNTVPSGVERKAA